MSQLPSGANIDLSLFANFPAGTPPNGVKPNFDNPVSAGPTAVILASVVMALLIGFAFNRYYVKLRIARQYEWDDCMRHVAESRYSFIESRLLM